MVAPMATSVTSGAKLSPGLMGKIEASIKVWLEEEVLTPDFFKKYIALYASAFTEEELRELTAFYRTPLGLKALTTLPVLTGQSNDIAQQAVSGKQPQLMQRLQPLIPAIEAERMKAKKK